MKALIVTADFPRWDGGVAVLGEKLAEFMSRAGAEVTVVTPLQCPEDRAFDAAQRYRVLRVRNVKDRFLKYLCARWFLGRLMSRETFDAVLATTWFPFAPAALNAAPSVPLTVMAHGNDFLEQRWQRPFWNRRMRRTFDAARCVITCSRESERAVSSLMPGLAGKVRTVFPGVDAAEFSDQAAPEPKPVLLTLGRLVERKGQDMVLRALPRIAERVPEIEYWIAGRGSDRARLEALSRTLGVEARVKFLGFVPAQDRGRLYQRCWVYLMPSRTIGDKGDFEGFGITYLEANACGRPVIGGRSGGVGDAVVNGVNGFLVDPESPAEIADRVVELLTDRDLREQLGRQGRERVERDFQWASVAARVRQLMEKGPAD